MKEREAAAARESEGDFMVTNSLDGPAQGAPRYRSTKMTPEENENSATQAGKPGKRTGGVYSSSFGNEGAGGSSARAVKPLPHLGKSSSGSKKDLAIQGSSGLGGGPSSGPAHQPRQRKPPS